MNIDKPQKSHIPALRALWKEAFGDTDAFIDSFFKTAFSPDRCRIVKVDSKITSALYWFDCIFENRRVAYIYAVATLKTYRGQGLASKLISDTHKHIRELGYSGSLLVPGEKALFDYYGHIGYKVCGYVSEFDSAADGGTAHLQKIDKYEYAEKRIKFLPGGAVVQEKENLDFLETYGEFYLGEDFLLAAHKENNILRGIELLGNTGAAPQILSTLGFKKGYFRTNGKDKPFAMYFPLDEYCAPTYFGLAFD